MKVFQASLLAASVISMAGFVGCSTTPKSHEDMTAPAITTSATHNNVQVGETVLVTANTMNLAGSKGIKWSVSPDNATLKAQKDSDYQTAMFSADQPGTYIVRAWATTGDGRTASSETTITVNGTARQ